MDALVGGSPMEQRERGRAVSVTLATATVVVAAFLPWGTVLIKPTLSFDFPGEESVAGFFGSLTMRVPMNGWNGTASFFGVALPNWFTVALAGMALVLAWLSATRIWSAPKIAVPLLAILGLAQTMNMLLGLFFSESSTLGVGVFVAIAGFLWMLAASLQIGRRPAPAPIGAPRPL